VRDYDFYSKQEITVDVGNQWSPVNIVDNIDNGVIQVSESKQSTAIKIASTDTVGVRVDQDGEEFLIYKDMILAGGVSTLQFKNGSPIPIGISIDVWGAYFEIGPNNPYYLSEYQSGSIITNEGATDIVYVVLPPVKRGLIYGFEVQNALGLRFIANFLDTIYGFMQTSTIGGYFQSTLVGSVIWVIGTDSGWVITVGTGVWTGG
jgi:hypothetical protein